VFLFALPLMERLAQVGRAHKVSSIADFIASRFGKSRALAVLVTVIAFSAAVPYIALQYKAVATSIDALTAVATRHVPWWRDTAFAVALVMALFAVLWPQRSFGTKSPVLRRADLRGGRSPQNVPKCASQPISWLPYLTIKII
jgi:Na+/proline symporter